MDYLYKNLNVKLLELTGDRLGFWTTVPLPVGEPFTVWKLLTVPFPFDGAARQVMLKHTEVAVGLNSGSVIRAEDCLFSNPRLCPAPIELAENGCVMGILAANQQQLSLCHLSLVDAVHDVKRLGEGHLLLYSDGETLQERCVGSPIATKEVKAGAYLVDVRQKCVVQSTKGWSYQALYVRRRVINVTDIFVLKPMNVTFHSMEQRPALAREVQQVRDLVISKQPALPDVSVLRSVKVYTVVGSTIGIGGAVVALVVLVVVMKWWCRRWWVGRKAQRAAVRPTSEEAIPMEPRRADPGGAPAMVAAPATTPAVPKLYLPLPEMIVAPPVKSQV